MTEGEDSVRPRRTQVSADYSSVVLPAQTNGCVIGMFIFSKPRSLPICLSITKMGMAQYFETEKGRKNRGQRGRRRRRREGGWTRRTTGGSEALISSQAGISSTASSSGSFHCSCINSVIRRPDLIANRQVPSLYYLRTPANLPVEQQRRSSSAATTTTNAERVRRPGPRPRPSGVNASRSIVAVAAAKQSRRVSGRRRRRAGVGRERRRTSPRLAALASGERGGVICASTDGCISRCVSLYLRRL